ncbi:MAG: HPr family phosphocarrier protein [Lautropia sp.]|nr:HPr family phosphocarrier protein [Lautropia sp.]
MKTAEVRVVNRLGVHARPSAALTQLATRFKSGVWLTKGGTGRRVNGKSIMGVMMLAAACGSTLHIEVDGEDEDEALQALTGLIESGFGEDTPGGSGC